VAFGPLPSSDARDLLLHTTSYVLEQHGLPEPTPGPVTAAPPR